MNPIMLHFASGLSLFSGGMLLVALVVCKSFLLRIPVWVVDLLAVIGLALVCLSGTPMPLVMIIFFIGSLLIWLMLIHLPARFAPVVKRFGVLVAVWLVVLMVVEGRYAVPAKIDKAPDRFYVIGDSISAGIGGAKWPEVLQNRGGVKINNLAVAGATVASAMSQAEKVPADGQLVLMEIGGNDLPGGASAADFGQGLERLLRKLDGHPIVMFELPLYPWTRDFGYEQRRLAQLHHVMLIPKREMAWVFTGQEATVDGLHLSQVGAERMADVVAQVLRLGNDR